MNDSSLLQAKIGLSDLKFAIIGLVTTTVLAGCGQGLASVQQIDGGLASAQSRKLVKQNQAGQAGKVVLRIPDSLIKEVRQKLKDVETEEKRRNEEEGPFITGMIGGTNSGVKRPTYSVFLDDFRLHVSANNFKNELEELTYNTGNHRQFHKGYLEVPYMARQGLKVSYYFTLSPYKMNNERKRVPLEVRYINDRGKNYQATLEVPFSR